MQFPGIQQNVQDLAGWLKTLAEPNRLQIFNLLMNGVQCNCELGDSLHMAPNLISHHLSVLRRSGLIRMERDASDGRWVYYSINSEALAELHTAMGDFFNPQRIQKRQPSCGPKIVRSKDETIPHPERVNP